MAITGTLGPDWLRKHGANGTISDEQLRAWRDHLEAMLRSELDIDGDFAIGYKTHFSFNTPSETQRRMTQQLCDRLPGFRDGKNYVFQSLKSLNQLNRISKAFVLS